MSKRYMLDTNMASHLLRGHPAVLTRVVGLPMAAMCLSAVTEGELLFGLAKRPGEQQLHTLVQELLRRVEVLPWDSAAAACYGQVRADLAGRGKVLAPLDLMIGSHAQSVGAVLVSNDGAFKHMNDLQLEDWALSVGGKPPQA